MKIILVELCLFYIFIKLEENLEILFICHIKTNKLYFNKQCTKNCSQIQEQSYMSKEAGIQS